MKEIENIPSDLLKANVTEAGNLPADLEKLQLLGRLLSGVTHEINTPMHYLENNLTFMKSAFKSLLELYSAYRQLINQVRAGGTITAQQLQALTAIESEVEVDYLHDELGQALSQSLEGIDMVSKIVLALKDFSHPSLHEFSLTDVNKCVDTVCTISRHEWKRVADLKLELAGDLPFLFCSHNEIHQVLLNLVVNAAHAIGAKITAKTYDRGVITVSTNAVGEQVEIKIADDGPGILAEHLPLIFNRNFTTKTAGNGTGQGLNLVQEIVEKRHGGTITLTSVVGEGSVFTVLLPHRPDEKRDSYGAGR